MAQDEPVSLHAGPNQLLRKLMTTALAGGGTFMVTNLTNEPQSWALVLSLLIGGITLLVQFLVDLENRQRVVEEHVGSLERANVQVVAHLRQTLAKEIAKIGAATALYDRLERSPLTAGSIVKVVQLAANVFDGEQALAHQVAKVQLDNVIAFLEQLSHRREITYEGEDRDWLLALTQLCRRSMDATTRGSVSSDGTGFIDEDFWETELSHRYLEWQRLAIRRGVRVRRLFILERAELVDHPELRQICDQQRRMGIEIRTLAASTLSSSQRSMLPDLVLFDEEISYELTAGPGTRVGPASYFIKTSLIVQPHVVRQRVQLFADLWEDAVGYKDAGQP